MPNIVFASNNITHFPNANAGSVVGSFDPQRVPYTIAVENREELNSPTFPAVAGDDTWFHFRTYFDSLQFGGTDTLLKAYDDSDHLLFDVRKRLNDFSYAPAIDIFDGDQTNTVNCTIQMTLQKSNSVDIRFTRTNLLLRVEVYVNGSLSGSTQFGSNNNDYGKPVRFTLGGAYVEAIDDIQHYSEIIVADGDTRNARLDLLRPAAAGHYDSWDGLLASLADDDTTTGMTTVDPNTRHTMTMSTYNGASNISNFIAVSQTTRGQNSPSKLKHSVRLSGVDYDGPEHDIDYALAYQITDYAINPATSLPWEGSDIAAIETGFVSVA